VGHRATGTLSGPVRPDNMIYLMRHADAVSEEEDSARPLSARGRDQVARVCAALLGRPGFKPSEIWHSPLVRSRETAELLAKGLGLRAPLVETAGLRPNDDPAGMAAVLAASKQDVAVVGHEPHLGVLASLMVRGPECAGVYYPFAKAGLLALSNDGKRWRTEWLVRSP
jgi:phosphohistidine phosphatase